nr:metallophosphoesterase [Candidatus Sigynarchaeota archaeon]
AGDVTLGAKHENTIKRAFDNLGAMFPPHKNVYYIPGNHDPPALAARGWGPTHFILVHDSVHVARAGSIPGIEDDIAIIGFGGATLGLYNNFAFPDEEILARLDSLFRQFSERESQGGKNMFTILLVHDPPVNTTLDFTYQKKHVGSRSVRAIIETYQPDIALSGHIHESPGIDRIGHTLCVNAGEARYGKYAVITVDGHTIDAQLCSV